MPSLRRLSSFNTLLVPCNQLDENDLENGQSYQEIETPVSICKEHRIYDISTPPSNVDDVNALILQAVKPPDHKRLTFLDTIQMVGMKAYKDKQFARLQSQTEMNSFTLLFNELYENKFKVYMQKKARTRIRYTVAIGFFSLSLYYIGSAMMSSEYTVSPNSLHVTILQLCIALPALVLVYIFTYFTPCLPYYEIYVSAIFVIEASIMIAEKIILKQKGPIINLFVLFIPIFGITRMRLCISLSCAIVILSIYLIANLTCGNESHRNVIFQGFNYLTVIIGGYVSHYRQEVLRRRNFALCIPFPGKGEANFIYEELQTSKYFRKHLLMKKGTLSFKNVKVEQTFYRYWYLIDSFPYEHPNAGKLHINSFLTIRFAIGCAIVNQVALAFQDVQFLKGSSSEWIYALATVMRFGIVVPAYMSSSIIMFLFGRTYYKQWTKESGLENRGGIPMTKPNSPKQKYSAPAPVPVAPVPYRDHIDKNYDYDLEANGPRQSNYVKTMQFISTTIVFLHGFAMGVILLCVAVQLWYSANTAPCYFLGVLNAILFPHRSGFRMRYIYATTGTTLLVIVLTMMFYVMYITNLYTIVAYLIVVLLLGMMISYEEETLRRMFFVIRAIRMLQFDEWYEESRPIKPWIKKILLEKANNARSRLNNFTDPNTKQIQRLLKTEVTMANASKFGLYFDIGNAFIAAMSYIF